MIFSLFSRSHWHACLQKQTERQFDIDSLPPAYSAPLSSLEEKIHALSLSQLVSDCKAGVIAPSEVMLTYGKKTLIAQKLANCITDIMFDEALQIPSVVNWPHAIDPESSLARDRPLLGVPVSIKDTIDIAGHDSTIGYSRNVFHPAPTSSAIVRLLQDAGALVHVKTTAPTGLLGMETVSDIFGRTSNPYNNAYTSGASTGGGAALLACGGSKIEIGSDLGGSVRIPAHFCGVWSLKGSAGRFPSWGGVSSVQGLEGVPLVTAPMAGSLADLEEFWKRVVEAKPWEYDHTCLPIPWKSVDLQEEGRKLKWGVMLEDGVVPPSPACRRALRVVTAALRKQGHEVVDFSPPDVWSGLKIGYQLVFSDGGEQIRSLLSPSETLPKASASILSLLSLPRFIKRILAYFSRNSDPLTADALQIMHPKSVKDVRALNAQKEAYQAAWHEKWTESGLDFILSVPHPFPAFKHGESEKVNLMTAGFTFLFSMLDYTAGVLPVTFVDKEIDGLPDGFLASREYASMNAVAKGAYSVYDVEGMHGLPLGVQVVGRRMEEERVMEAMKVVEACLKREGTVFIGHVKA
ncbi:Acetamidase [Hypsizygus marmoreus]|uniref:Acetamidase n=1 Tax=Hypsizygus marmoreus TaxID=39966 RepID=A0A369K6M3_HYPMA|nr:Acetamidase [Hypsizygus marmoreus]